MGYLRTPVLTFNVDLLLFRVLCFFNGQAKCHIFGHYRSRPKITNGEENKKMSD